MTAGDAMLLYFIRCRLAGKGDMVDEQCRLLCPSG